MPRIMKLVGVEKRKGDFSDKVTGKEISYDNYLLHIESEFDGEKGQGIETNILKIKRETFEKISDVKEPENLIGYQLEFGYTLYAGKPVLSAIKAI